MTRRFVMKALISLILVTLLAPAAAYGADKPVKSFIDREFIPARFAPVYSFPGLTGNEYTAPPNPPERNLRGSKSGEGIIETIGSTTYDHQHNSTMSRQIEHRAMYTGTQYGTYVHFDWMHQWGDTLGGGRGVKYQAYEIATCNHVFAPGGIRIEGSYSGYVSMDAHNLDAMNSWGVPMAHESDDGDYKAKAYWDFIAGGPVFGVFTSDFSWDHYGWWQNNGTGPGNETIWPHHDWDIDGEDYVLHLVTSESGGAAGDPQTCSYHQRVGPYGTGLGVWSDQHVIDTVMNINVTVASSPISDKLAIVWNAPVDYERDTPDEFNSQYENDVWFAIATDNGTTWANTPTNMGNPSIGETVDLGNGAGYIPAVGGNLTLYDPMDDYKAYCDMSALWYIDEINEDWLQIVWGCRQWIDTTSLYRRQSAIFHWNQQTDQIRTVVKASWDTGGACYAHAWGGDVAKMNISQCDGKLYVGYTQFGDATHPCHYYDANDNIVAGLYFISVYDPMYAAWDRPQQVTTVVNPTPCIPGTMAGPGTCNSEYWGSMARYGRYDTCKSDLPGADVLDIIYINDWTPGDCVRGAGVWNVNPVNWAVYPCREAVPEPGYSDDAGPGYGDCVGEPILVLGTTDDTTFILTLENNGILDNPFTIAAGIDSGNGASNGANSSLDVNPTAGTIPGRGGTFPITVNIATVGEEDFTTSYGTITVTHQAGDNPPTDRDILVCITVNDTHVPLQSAVIATFCKKLRVYNNGQMGATNESMDFTDDPDDCANIYLYDGSPIICRDVGGNPECYFTIFGDNGLHPVSPMYHDPVSNPDYEYATAEYVTRDSTIGLIVEFYAPKAEENCCFMVEKLKFWNRTEVTLTHVKVGEALDWDVPSYEHASNNESGTDPTRELIYQSCVCPQNYHDPCDTLLDCERFAGIAAYKNNPFRSYMTLENDVYVYTSGPFGNDAPLPDDTMYALMDAPEGYYTAVIDSCEDLMTLVTFDVYDLEPGDTMCVVKILTTSKVDAGAAQLKANVDNANAFIDAHEEIQCPGPTGVCNLDPLDPLYLMPGDANNDEQVNVGDAVKIINFVFKGGDPPEPYPAASGDANGDCQTNVGDAVKIINFVFKGGDPPVTCEEDVAACGEPPFGP